MDFRLTLSAPEVTYPYRFQFDDLPVAAREGARKLTAFSHLGGSRTQQHPHGSEIIEPATSSKASRSRRYASVLATQ